MPDKRPYPDDGAVQDATKRPRSNNASPAPTVHGAAVDIASKIAEARARAEAVKARLAGSKGASPAPASSAPTPPPPAADAARAKIEAMRARVAAAAAMAQERTATPTPAYPPDLMDGSKARGGLGVGLHPALMGDTAPAKGKQGAKFATTMGNRRAESPLQKTGKEKRQLDLSGPNIEELKSNPYFDASIAAPIAGCNRQSRQLVFNQKGKYIEQATALRRQAKLEEMKRRIAAQAKLAGMDEDVTEKNLLVPAPPEIEWWDEGLVNGTSYDALSSPSGWKIDTPDSIITVYVQHPVLMAPNQEKLAPPPKPMFLTAKEQAKLRRQRRAEEHKEQQAKIRLGLEPPPPPKMKMSNLMRVAGDSAVKDPTAVEAMVRRQVAEREAKHRAENEERKLTKEERHAKLARNQDADAAKGIHVAVYKIDNLSFGKHRYQIDVNAKQHALTGICILTPKFNLVLVEGGRHSIDAYRKLMERRIDWTANERNLSAREKSGEDPAWLRNEAENGEVRDNSGNRCQLVWEGLAKQRGFRRWGSKALESEKEAMELLAKHKYENMWTLAKSIG